MALARVQYAADGNTDTFSLTFPYLNKGDVKVSLDGSETTAFSWSSSSSIKLDSTPSSGVIVDIKRETERDSILVDFQDGSTLLESDLDLAARQSFYLAQESFDQTGSTLAVANDGSYSASDRRISLLGYPTQSGDAANKQYVDDTFAQGEDAAAMADEAENWANHPEDSLVPEGDQVDDYSALHHAKKAGASASSASSDASSASSDASAANTSASNAAASESNAATSEANAADSAAAAQASEDDVAANASAAATSEANAADSEANAASSASTASSEASDASDSASAAATSESNASQSASDASTSATNASNSEDAAATSESNAANSASAASISEDNAQTSEDNADAYAIEARNWAKTAENTLVPEGDQVDDYSALHWARKAEDWAQSLNLPSASGEGGKFLRQTLDESGLEYVKAPPGENLIIDGQFNFWDEGTSHSTSGYGSSTLWQISKSGGSATLSRQDHTLGQTEVPDGGQHFAKYTVDGGGGSGEFIILTTRLEDVIRLSDKTVTLSFYARSDESLSVGVELEQYFGDGSGLPNVDSIGVTKLDLTSSWAKYTVTADLPSLAGKTLGEVGNDHLLINFWCSAGSDYNSRNGGVGTQTGSIDFSRVKLEFGSQATEGGWRHVAEERALVGRYFETYSEVRDFSRYLNVPFKVKKRAKPSVSYSKGVGSDVSAVYPETDRIIFAKETDEDNQVSDIKADSRL